MIENFKKLVNERSRELGGLNNASKLVYEDFKKAEDSLLNKNVETYSKMLLPGKIFSFKYYPIHKDVLSYYDKHPVVLSVGRRKVASGRILDLGINMNFLPFKAKVALIDTLSRAYKGFIKRGKFLNSNNASSQGSLPINWEIAKRLLGPYANFALRSYYIDRRTSTVVYSYEKWVDLMFLDVKEIEGASLASIYKLYNRK